MSNRGLARGALITLVARVTGICLGLAVVLITARLGTQDQGTYALFVAVESALLMIGSGFGVSLARRISHHGERPGDLVGTVVLSSLVAGVVAAAGMLLVVWGVDGSHGYLLVLASGAIVMFITPTLSGLWLGTARMGPLAFLNVLPPGLTLVGIGLAATSGGTSLMTVLWSWMGARVVVAIGAFVAAMRSGWVARPRFASLSSEWRFVVVIGLTNLVGLLNYKMDLFLVEHFLGRGSTGIYSIAVSVGELLWLGSSSITQAAYARIGTPDRDDAARMTVRVIRVSLAVLALAAPCLAALAVWLLPALLGPEYAVSASVLVWLLPGIVLYGAASPLSAYFTNHAGRPQIPATLAALSLAINIVLSIWLIPALGLVGGALATTGSYVLSILVALIVFRMLSGLPLRTFVLPDGRGLRHDLEARS